MRASYCFALAALAWSLGTGVAGQSSDTALFEGHYRVTGGANGWAAADAFPFAWKRISGDVSIAADGQFASSGSRTWEMRPALTAPVRTRLERRGNQFSLAAGQPGEPLTTTETALVSSVRQATAGRQAQARPPQQRYRSHIVIYDLQTKQQKELMQADEIWEAPNWMVDGKFLLANSGGNLYRIAVDGTGKPEKLDVGTGVRCNNDHGFTRDGKLLAFSASSQGSGGSQVYVVAADGTGRRSMTTKAPSYFHGWSPDGKWLAIVANRTGNYDLFRIPVEGGTEEQLTSNTGYDDGPDYSPDGRWIYFNSNRAGNYDVWRMPADGAGPGDGKAEQVTSDEWEDWFPHPSPDGKRLVFLSFPKGTADHNGKMEVELRMLPLPGKKVGKTRPETVLKIFGGQGTINVNSWAPDSKRLAFVTYELLRP